MTLSQMWPHLTRWVFTCMLIVANIFTMSNVPVGNEPVVLIFLIFALGAVVIPFLFEPTLLLCFFVLLSSATPIGAALFTTSGAVVTLAPAEISMCMLILVYALCARRAYPLWKGWSCEEPDLGPRDFWLTPLLLLGFVTAAHLSGANNWFCLALVAAIQVWQFIQAVQLDGVFKKKDVSQNYDAPIGA